MTDKQQFDDLNISDFKALKIQLASSEAMRSWSHGEVTESETINYRTLKPEKDGLFCERIFGPTKDWECYCGKYKHRRYEGVICDKCGVEVTHSRVRRERMGHIDLAAPCAHVWYFKGSVSPISILFGVSNKYLKQVIYFSTYLVVGVDEKGRDKVLANLGRTRKSELDKIAVKQKKRVSQIKEENKVKKEETKEKIKDKEARELALGELEIKAKRQIRQAKEDFAKQEKTVEKLYDFLEKKVKNIEFLDFLDEEEYFSLRDHNAAEFIEVGMGAEAILQAVEEMDLNEAIKDLRKAASETRSKNKTRKIYQRINLIKNLIKAEIDPSWMVLQVLPVLPPDLRPMVQLGGGKFATSDLNDLYRRVINRNNRLKNLIEIGAPEIILRNEKRMLQESVDNLIDKTQIRRRRNSRQKFRSLSEMLKGKKGRFRQNLLGKRVDYSGRSVIIVGPNLRLNQCGLPKEIALEMYKPYVLHEMIMRDIAPNIRSAKVMLENRPDEVYDILEDVVEDRVVLLNRAPTLHKLSVQAFYPVLVDGKAIQLHPCVCSGFNADFDGDQMAVHLPLSEKAQEEAKKMMTPANNLLKPADGSPTIVPSKKEMALGIYYITSENPNLEKFAGAFDKKEAWLLYEKEFISLRQPIDVLIEEEVIETTIGRIMFNELLPETIGYINDDIDSPQLKDIFARLFKEGQKEVIVKLADAIKDLGFWGGTVSGLSFGINDNLLYEGKEAVIEEAEGRVLEIEDSYNQGLITEEEKNRLSQQVWIETTEELADKTWELFDITSPVRLIIDAKVSRASRDQVKQLSAMRGLLVDPMGNIVPMPTKSNFREGLSVFEYVTSARGSRKGLTDTALKTADAGYLTRRLVDAAHDVIVRSEDCGTNKGITINRKGVRGDRFEKRVLGRVLAESVIVDDEEILAAGDIIEENHLDLLEEKEVAEVTVRSPLTCQTPYGVCAKCYGWDFSTKEMVTIGTPVGVIAAQSIGEPGTQLTLRTKHSGGVIGEDVTQGLPRVEELFEVRTPKTMAPIAEIDGEVISVEEDEGGHIVVVQNEEEDESREYYVPGVLKLQAEEGDKVLGGTRLASGALDIEEVLAVRGRRAAQRYLLAEIQAVYESQGIPIRDRHFEVLIRKMSEKVKVTDPGDTDLIIDSYVDWEAFNNINKTVRQEGKDSAQAEHVILGISKTALNTESWLSAASFQTTTKVLTYASLEGKVDNLLGLKENVIIGRLIPTSPERARIDPEDLYIE